MTIMAYPQRGIHDAQQRLEHYREVPPGSGNWEQEVIILRANLTVEGEEAAMWRLYELLPILSTKFNMPMLDVYEMLASISVLDICQLGEEPATKFLQNMKAAS